MNTSMVIYLLLGMATSHLLERYIPDLFQPRLIKRPFYTGQVVGVILLWWLIVMVVGALWLVQKLLPRTQPPSPAPKSQKLEAVPKAPVQMVPTYDPIRHPRREPQPARLTGDHTGG